MAKQQDKNSKDLYQIKLIMYDEGNVLVKKSEILKRWHEYFNKLMNEENPRYSRQETQKVVEEETSGITGEEVEKALKKRKNELNKIITEEKIPDEWRKRSLIPIYKNKGYIMKCGNYRGIKHMSHSMKLSYKRNSDLLRVFIDLEKAYDRVSREELYSFLPSWTHK
nr:uncharacterized protein LOC113813691 [Penaeus vannamei]